MRFETGTNPVVCVCVQTETPKFSQLRLLYPGYRHHGGRYSTDDVVQLVLGVNASSTASLADRESVRGGSAAVRLSWTLNRYGGRHALTRDAIALRDSVTGVDGRQYIFRDEALGRFLAVRYGDPVVDRGHEGSSTRRRRRRRRSWPSLAGRQGIVRVVRHAGGRDDGHVGLWDCDRFHESRDWTLDAHLLTVEFWESAGTPAVSVYSDSTLY